MLNIVAVQGYMVKDVIMRTSRTGQKIAKGTIAINSDYKRSATGDYKVDFFDFTAWNMTAENLRKYFPKGKQAILVGHLEMNQYEDTTGRKRRNTEIMVQMCYFCGKKSDVSAEAYPEDAFIPPEGVPFFVPDEEFPE